MKERTFWVVPAVLALIALGACSKGDDGEGIATANGGTASASADPNRPSDDPEVRVRQFVGCMRAEGIDMPDPQPGDKTGKSALQFEAADGASKEKLGKAMEKCDMYLPGSEQDRQITPEQLEQMRQYAKCMRENGFPDFPDPDPQEGFKNVFGPDLRKDDPAVRAAIEKCRGAR
jgi:hypothetical protein